MKVCNYCGTSMDNDVMKCPFCRMEMDIRGAVKYQDDENLDDSDKEKAWDDYIKWAESQEQRETPKIDFNLPDNTEKKTQHAWDTFKAFFCVIVFIIITVVGIAGGDFEEEEYYPSTENFVVGSFENYVYQNEYAGITYCVNDGFDSFEFYPFAIPEIDEDFTFVTEFYVERANDHMYISYENADYCECETIQEYVDTLYTSGPGTELISTETVTIRGEEFYKVITYNEYERQDGEIRKYYYCALVRKVTDDYFAMIEVNTEKLESIDEFLLGFEYAKDFEEV